MIGVTGSFFEAWGPHGRNVAFRAAETKDQRKYLQWSSSIPPSPAKEESVRQGFKDETLAGEALLTTGNKGRADQGEDWVQCARHNGSSSTYQAFPKHRVLGEHGLA